MKLRCPECKSSLNDSFSCANGHHYHTEDNVLILLNKKEKERLYQWLVDFEDFRSDKIDPLRYDNLPFSGTEVNEQIWKARISDLKLVNSFLLSTTKEVLDFGSWNGWLAHQLSTKGIAVTAIDYFIHELDGLKAKNQYSSSHWNSIQMNIEDLSVFVSKFDLIIFNRCLSYFENPVDLLKSAMNILNEQGQIIVTGINIRKKAKEESELVQSKREFQEKYGKNLVFNHSKGYLDYNDLNEIKKLGFKITPYRNFKNLIKFLFFKNKPVSYYCVLSRE